MSNQFVPSLLGVSHQQQQHGKEETVDIVNARPEGTNGIYQNFHNMPYYENQICIPEIKNNRLLPTSDFNHHVFTVSEQQGRNVHPNTDDSGFVSPQSGVTCKPEEKGNSLKMERDISGAKNSRRKRRKYNKKIHIASCNDILSGRGHGVNRHAGNVKFREIISRYKLAYSTSSPPAKKQVTLQVLAEIQKLIPPGRFLVQNLEGKTWEELPLRKAKRKISQALREKPKKFGSGTKKIGLGFVSTSEPFTKELENKSKDNDCSSSEYDVDHDARSSDESDDESDSSNDYTQTNRYIIQNNMNKKETRDGLRGEGNDESTAQQRFATQSLPPLPIAPQKGSKSGIHDQRPLEDIATTNNPNAHNYIQQLNQNILLAAAAFNDGGATATDNAFQQHMNMPSKFHLQTSSTLPSQSLLPAQIGNYVQLVNQHQEYHPALMQHDFEVSNARNHDRRRIQDGTPSFALSPLAGKFFKTNDYQTCAFVNYDDMSIRYNSDDDADNASIVENANTDNMDSDKGKAAGEFFEKMVTLLSTCDNLSALFSVMRSGCESFSDFPEIFARRESIIQPTDKDVIIIRKEESLAGSRRDVCEDYHDDNKGIHMGNMRLVECIHLSSNNYGNPQVTPNETRTNIVKTTLQSIKNEGGRFLLKERDKDKGGPTFQKLTEECTERILQALFLQCFRYILFPACNDVLLGRDGVYRLNQGNLFFKSIILANKTLLQTLNCVEDVKKVAIEIIFQIRARNGRFLMSCNQSGMWQVLDHADAVEEVRRVLSKEFGRA